MAPGPALRSPLAAAPRAAALPMMQHALPPEFAARQQHSDYDALLERLAIDVSGPEGDSAPARQVHNQNVAALTALHERRQELHGIVMAANGQACAALAAVAGALTRHNDLDMATYGYEYATQRNAMDAAAHEFNHVDQALTAMVGFYIAHACGPENAVAVPAPVPYAQVDVGEDARDAALVLAVASVAEHMRSRYQPMREGRLPLAVPPDAQ